MKHFCHVPQCGAPCPPRHLMCKFCWSQVPKNLQDEVYRTVDMRGKHVDETWAPWWDAQAKAIDHVLRARYPNHTEFVDKILKREMDFVEYLKAK